VVFISEDTNAEASGEFDHWGATECGLQLGEIETRGYPACPLRRAARIGALIVFISILFATVSAPVQQMGQ
jgi:hypothetical protein